MPARNKFKPALPNTGQHCLLKTNDFGEPAGTRTQGPRLKRAMLYRLSYRLTAGECWDCFAGRITVFTGSDLKYQPLLELVVLRLGGASGFRRIIVS